MFCDKPRAAGGDPSVVSAWARKGDRMRTLRLPVGALLVALMLGAVLAVGASATPVAKTVATVECRGRLRDAAHAPRRGRKGDLGHLGRERAKRSQLPHQARRSEPSTPAERWWERSTTRWDRRPVSASRSPVRSRCTRTASTCTGHCTLCGSRCGPDESAATCSLTRHSAANAATRCKRPTRRRAWTRYGDTPRRRTASTSPPT